MNELARDVLVKAALDGVPQSFSTLRQIKWLEHKKVVSYCTIGLLHLAFHQYDQAAEYECGSLPDCGWAPHFDIKRYYSVDGFTPVGLTQLNDLGRLSFLDIARKAQPFTSTGYYSSYLELTFGLDQIYLYVEN